MLMAPDGTHFDPSLKWVFGYGSLIWNPGFPHRAAIEARLIGAHRALCIYSHRHRGTAERPGLVFGLMRGGSCKGMAFGVAEEDWPEVLAYLTAREQSSGVYREAHRRVRSTAGETLSALVYLVNESHPQFAGRLPLARQLEMVREGHGESGANVDYVRNTVRHLQTLGIGDRDLEALCEALERSPRPATSLKDA